MNSCPSTRSTTPHWFQPANLPEEGRFLALRDLLGADPYVLVIRLFDLTALVAPDGDLSEITDHTLAERLEPVDSPAAGYRSSRGAQLRRWLTAAGYLDQDSQVVGWDELRALA